MKTSEKGTLEKDIYKNGLKETDEARRIGIRIRFCRTALGLRMSELGQRVGLSADRIQQYENGFRKPRPPLLKKLAAALGVDPRALADPCLSTDVGVMHALFEMELLYGLRVSRQSGRIVLSFRDREVLPASLEEYLNEWERAYSAYTDECMHAKSDEAVRRAIKKYCRWKIGFPGTTSEESMTEKAEIEKQIADLQRRLEELDKQ